MIMAATLKKIKVEKYAILPTNANRIIWTMLINAKATYAKSRTSQIMRKIDSGIMG